MKRALHDAIIASKAGGNTGYFLGAYHVLEDILNLPEILLDMLNEKKE